MKYLGSISSPKDLITKEYVDNNFELKVYIDSITTTTTWSGSGPYTQVVTLSGYTVTNNSKIDIQPNANSINQLIADGVNCLYIENNNSVLTLYAIGSAPTMALTLQVSITEVTTA